MAFVRIDSTVKRTSEALPLKEQDQYSFLKRLFDVGFSCSMLLLLFPLFLVSGIAIVLCSPGPIFYTQIRLGRRGKPFKCYKFRTMHLHAEKELRDILQKNPHLKSEWEQNQKLKTDPRVFLVGRLLRKTSLDELPQFWNALKGDVSVVGPRPYMVNQRKELGHQAYKILSMRPGITGLWQTSGRNNTTFQERMRLDAQYIEKQSFWYDVWLIVKTIPEIFCSKNAC